MTAKQPIDFSVGDDLSDMLGSGAPAAPRALPTAPEFERIRKEVPQFTETCPSCRGTGQFRSYAGRPLGQCFKCKGKGNRTFATSPQERAAARDAASRRKVEALKTFDRDHPVEMAWLKAKSATFDFAEKMIGVIRTHGGLSENQMATVARLAARDQERKQASQAQADARSTSIDCRKIAAAFDAARSKGLKRPRMTVGSLRFSLAPAGGKNAGAIYVKTVPPKVDGLTAAIASALPAYAGEQTPADGQYLGKIIGAVFHPAREATAEQVAEVLAMAADPLEAAKAHGRKTGICSCCSRELTDAESVRLGIGPICAAKYGF